jgi:hypothetical protein
MSTSNDWLANARFDSPDPEHTAWLHEQDVKYGRVEPANDKERALRQGVLDQLGSTAAGNAPLERGAEAVADAPEGIRIGANTAEWFHVGDDAYTVEVALLDGHLAYYSGGNGKHPYLTKEQAVDLAGVINNKGSIAPSEWVNGNGYPLQVADSTRRELEEERAVEDERSGIDCNGV